jgi:predicted glycosyltransferase
MALVSLALETLPLLERSLSVDLTIVVGPYFDQDRLKRLQEQHRDRPRMRFLRFIEDFRRELSRSHVSVTRCGYNTFLDIVQTGVRAVVIPRSVEPEQEIRARLLERAGGGVAVREADAGPQRLEQAVLAALRSTPAPISIDTAGCQQVARRVEHLLDR